MGWSGRARFCVLVCDSPGHGSELHDGTINDSHPRGIGGLTAESMMKTLREKDIELLMCYLQPKTTRVMDTVFRYYVFK